MILSGTPDSFISLVNYNLRGTDDDAPIEGDEDYVYWLAILKMKLQDMYEDPNKHYPNTFQVLELGTVAAKAVPSFDLDEGFLDVANQAYIIDNRGMRSDFDVVKPEEVDVNTKAFYIAGEDPQVLYFTREIPADSSFVGGKLYLPAFVVPDMPSKPKDLIPAPSPNGMVYIVASQVAENDLTYEDKAPSLLQKANRAATMMAAKARSASYGNSRKTPRRVVKIGQRHR
jgi:hypothetical protein